MNGENAEYSISLKDLFSGNLDKADKAAHKFEGSVNSLKANIHDLGVNAAEVFLGFEAFEFIKDAGKEFIESELSLRKLSLAVGNKGGLASDLKELQEQAETLQDKGIFSHDTTEQIETMGLHFGLTVEQVEKAIPVVEDFAAATGIDATEAMRLMDGGAAGMARALKRDYGIAIKDTGNEAKNFAIVIDALTKKFKGQNETIRETTKSGMIAGMTNEFKQFKEDAGEQLLEIFELLVPYIKEFLHVIKSGLQWIKEHHTLIKALVITMGSLYTIFKLSTLAAGVYEAIMGVGMIMALTEATAAQLALNLAMAATPWGIAAVGVGLLVAGVMELIDAYDEVKKEAKEANDEILKETDKELESLRNKTEELQKHKHLTQEIAAQQVISAEKNSLTKYIKTLDDQLADLANESLNDAGATKAIRELNQKKSITQSQLDLMNKGKDGKSIYDLIKTPTGKKGKVALDDSTGGADKVTEPKHTIINININKFIEAFTVATQTLTEGAQVTKETITKALLSGVEDAQIIGGG